MNIYIVIGPLPDYTSSKSLLLWCPKGEKEAKVVEIRFAGGSNCRI